MSSSSAMVVAFFLALAKINRLSERPEYRENIHNQEDLAGYLATIENGQTFRKLAGDNGVGTFGGSEDHTAILCAKPAPFVNMPSVRFDSNAKSPFPRPRAGDRCERSRGGKDRRRP